MLADMRWRVIACTKDDMFCSHFGSIDVGSKNIRRWSENIWGIRNIICSYPIRIPRHYLAILPPDLGSKDIYRDDGAPHLDHDCAEQSSR